MRKKRSGGKSAGKAVGREFTIGGFTRKELKELKGRATRGLVKDDRAFDHLVFLIRAVKGLEYDLDALESVEKLKAERMLRRVPSSFKG